MKVRTEWGTVTVLALSQAQIGKVVVGKIEVKGRVWQIWLINGTVVKLEPGGN